MTYEEAASATMPIGKYKGKTVEEIGRTDDGLVYLDWLIGQDWFTSPIQEAVRVYLADPNIARDLAELLEDS